MRFLVLAFMVCPALCAAQAGAPAAKPEVKAKAAQKPAPGPVTTPEVKVDDRWVYRRTDKRMKPPTLVYEIRVSFVDARVIHTVVERQGGQRDSDATWTREWNSVVAVDEGVVEIDKPMLQFPLAVGRQYPAAWVMRRPRAGGFEVKHQRTVKVVGWEDLEVPAGRFRAVKIEATGGFQRVDKPLTGQARNTYWYVPQVKRWVKTTYTDGELVIDEELYFYRVQ